MELAAYEILARVRQQKPLVHHITNWVTIYDCAQIVKTLGASPVMAHAPEEVAEMTGLASAVVLNIGTLTSDLVNSMKLAALAANKRNVPVILDACGAGATRMRDRACASLMDSARIDVIKGNASEIASLVGEAVRTRGVDSGTVGADVGELARKYAVARKATVVVTGATDIVTNGTSTVLVHNGHEMMAKVVGTGCMAASVIGTFAAVEPNLVMAAAAALACYGIAGELAARRASGPVGFRQELMDELYRLDEATVARMQRVALRA